MLVTATLPIKERLASPCIDQSGSFRRFASFPDRIERLAFFMNRGRQTSMSSAVEHPNQNSKRQRLVELEPEQAELVVAELERILSSRFFRNAVRSRQFLEFVVTHKI